MTMCQSNSLKALALSIVLITGSSVLFFPGNHGNVDPRPWENFIFSDYKAVTSTEGFVKDLAINKYQYGNILFDEPLSALFVKNLSKKEYGYLNKFETKDKKNAETVVFYRSKHTLNRSSLDVMKNIIIHNNLNNIYKVNDTNIILATKKSIKSDLLSKYDKLFTSFYLGSELPHNIGSIKDDDLIADSKLDKAGFISFGPYEPLISGQYKFEINYVSSEPDIIDVGEWDVVIALPKGIIKRVNKGKIMGTNGKEGYIVQNFLMPEKYSNEKIEIRNFFNGIGSLVIKNISITRF